MTEAYDVSLSRVLRLERECGPDEWAHVWPVDDRWNHEMSRMCACQPRAEPWHPQVIIHRRFPVH